MQGVSSVDVMTAVAITLRAAGVLVYLLAIQRGKAPSLTSWTVWTIAQFVAVGAQWSEVPLSVWLPTLGIALGSLLIVGMTVWRSKFKLTPTWPDLIYLSLAGIGLFCWRYLDSEDSALLAVLCCAGADLAGGVPTILKSWRDPTGEPRTTFGLFLGAATLTLVTAWVTVPEQERAWVAFVLPLYFIAVNLTMVLILTFKKPQASDQAQPVQKTLVLVE